LFLLHFDDVLCFLGKVIMKRMKGVFGLCF
jgi:hypothetical protein